MNFIKISTSVKGICLQDDLIADERPFHWREVSMALDGLPQVIDAVASVLLAKLARLKLEECEPR
jgi:hypothetical protein